MDNDEHLLAIDYLEDDPSTYYGFCVARECDWEASGDEAGVVSGHAAHARVMQKASYE